MRLELELLFAAGVGYLIVLFLVAYATERGIIPARVASHPLTSALALEPTPVDSAVADAWATLRIALRDTGQRMPINDSWIAATALALNVAVVTPAAVAACHAAGAAVFAWTVNDAARAKTLLESGIDGIIGDDPRILAPLA